MAAPISTINRSSTKPSKIGAAHFFLTILLCISFLLSVLAVQLSLQLSQSSQSQPGRESSSADHQAGQSVEEVVPAALRSEEYDVSTRVFLDNSGKYDKDRVYCMIPFIWNAKIYDAIMKTWGKRCDSIYFLTDAVVGGQLDGDKITQTEHGYKPYWEYPQNSFPKNVIFINMTRTWNDCPEERDRRTGQMTKKVCRHIWEKMWRSWVYVQEHHLDKAEWFCKVDYDTFFFPDNLKYFVRDQKNWDPYNEHHYFGHWKAHRLEWREPMIVGATACFSRKTLNAIADVYKNMPMGSKRGERGHCEDRAEATEEVTTSLCLKKHLNIDAEPARDDQLREYITIDKINMVLSWNRKEQGEWWFWKGKPQGAGEEEENEEEILNFIFKKFFGKPQGAGEEEECCAHRPIGLHKYKKPQEIQMLENQFFGDVKGPDYKRLNARTKRYVDKVRKAMGIGS
ncbi:hypothetical protein ACHAW6_011098 [Cyclotella cf. meneghiniana]